MEDDVLDKIDGKILATLQRNDELLYKSISVNYVNKGYRPKSLEVKPYENLSFAEEVKFLKYIQLKAKDGTDKLKEIS